MPPRSASTETAIAVDRRKKVRNLTRNAKGMCTVPKTRSLRERLSFGLLRSAPLVSVLRLSGVIAAGGVLRSALSLASLAPQIERAFAPRGQVAVALAVNSPGGSPVQSALIGRRIRALAEETETPVIAFIEDVAASGGYWLACAADEIFALPSSIVGSIGVVSAGFGFQDLIRRYGIERRVHTAGRRKVILDPFQEQDDEDVAKLRAVQDDIHEEFKRLVRTRRGDRLAASDEILFSGEFWTGRQAQSLGLVDGLDDLYTHLRGRFGARLRLRPVVRPRSLWPTRPGIEEAAALGQAAVTATFATAEERVYWSRFGL